MEILWQKHGLAYGEEGGTYYLLWGKADMEHHRFTPYHRTRISDRSAAFICLPENEFEQYLNGDLEFRLENLLGRPESWTEEMSETNERIIKEIAECTAHPKPQGEFACDRCGDYIKVEGDHLCGWCREEVGAPQPVHYKNRICPICHRSVSAAMHCRMHKALVCMEHCFENCVYMDTSTSLIGCNFLVKKFRIA